MLLRLTLVMLHETDAVLHTERIIKKKLYLRQVEDTVNANFNKNLQGNSTNNNNCCF